MKTVIYIILALLIAIAIFYLLKPYVNDTISIIIATIIVIVFASFYKRFEKRRIK